MPTSSERVLRAAVIGLGYIGAGDPVAAQATGHGLRPGNSHAAGMAAHPEVELAAGATRDAGRRERFAETYGVSNLYADWREMLASERLDIVGVATNTPTHADIVIGCAELGVRAVFCEKPVATTLRGADRMIAACRERGALLVINHNRRWDSLWIAARDLVRSGGLGEVQHVTCQWPTGRLGNMGSHMLDVAAFVIGRRPEAVLGALDFIVPPDRRGPDYHDPGGWGVVMFEGGVKVFVNAAHDVKAPFGLRVVGEKGELTVDATARVRPWDGEARVIASGSDGPRTFAAAVADIVECLRSGARPASTGEDGRDALEAIIGFHVSNRESGRWVSLPLDDVERDIEVKIGGGRG